jgi:hypothetical protein
MNKFNLFLENHGTKVILVLLVLIYFKSCSVDSEVSRLKKETKAMESELISKHPDTFSGEDDIPGSFLSEGVIKEDYKNDYANSEEDYTDEMVVEKIKDIIKYHELDPQDLIDEIRIEFGIDAMD